MWREGGSAAVMGLVVAAMTLVQSASAQDRFVPRHSADEPEWRWRRRQLLWTLRGAAVTGFVFGGVYSLLRVGPSFAARVTDDKVLALILQVALFGMLAWVIAYAFRGVLRPREPDEPFDAWRAREGRFVRRAALVAAALPVVAAALGAAVAAIFAA
jgi:hypothetical protein